MMDKYTRDELRELRAEFKELASHPDQPWGQWYQRSKEDGETRIFDAPYWRLAGFYGTQRTFDALAGRAATLAKLDGLNGWLDSLGTPEMDLVYQDGDARMESGKLFDIATLSVHAIDKLLAAPIVEPISPPATPRPKAVEPRKRRTLHDWLELLDQFESEQEDDSSLTETAFARARDIKPNTAIKMLEKARAERTRLELTAKKMRANR